MSSPIRHSLDVQKHLSHRVRLAAPALAVALSLLAAPAVSQATEQGRLDAVEAELEELRRNIEQAEQTAAAKQEALKAADVELQKIEMAVAAAEQAVQRQQRTVLTTAEELDSMRKERAAVGESLTRRVVEQYKRPPTITASLMGASTMEDAFNQLRYGHALARADRERIEMLSASAVATAALRDQLRREEEDLREVVAQKTAVLAKAEELRAMQSVQLAEAQSDVENLEQQEADLESESRQIAALAERTARTAAVSRSASTAPAAPAAAVPSQASVGGWIWPTSGPVTSGFGPRWGRMHEGIDIGAPTGAPIYAAAAGTVTYAGVMGGYGNLTLIDHGGVVSAYAHQTSIDVGVGTGVTAGQYIGSVGMTGNVTGPHLHFETRAAGTPVDPRTYLP